MERNGFLKVSKVLSTDAAAALRSEVLAELSKQPWWWGSWASKFARMASSGASTSSSFSSDVEQSMFQEANIRGEP
jgi:hypothetical protein